MPPVERSAASDALTVSQPADTNPTDTNKDDLASTAREVFFVYVSHRAGRRVWPKPD